MQIQRKSDEVLLEVENLKTYFPIKNFLINRKKTTENIKAVDGVSFKLYKGETYGLVGESGCGKSTTSRSILRLVNHTSGKVFYQDKNIFDLSQKDFRNIRKEIQMVFQDHDSSLNPRKRVGNILEETLKIHRINNEKSYTSKVIDILSKVGLNEESLFRYPHEFSGGQRQRIGLARALVTNPKIIIFDEPVSALDVSIQSQIINLMQELQNNQSLSYLFIAHDISVVRHISDRIGVMYLGKIVEEAPTDTLFSSASHPYTQALLSAVPISKPNIKKERIILKGDIPSPMNPPTGCVFHTRCKHAMEICKKTPPKREKLGDSHYVACHLY